MPSDSGVQIIAGGDTLQGNEKIAQLLTQLMQTGQAEQAANIRQLCGYVDSLEKQYAAVMSELQGIKEQLSEATAQKRPLRVQVSDAVQTAETALKQARDQLPTLKEDLAIWAETTANDLRRVGISVLDNTVAFLNIQQILENIRDALESALQSVRSAIHQVETMGQELREAGNHLANAGRAAAGREIQPKDVTQEGRFQAVVLAPLRGTDRMLTGMTRTTQAAVRNVRRLERMAEENRGRRERSSVRQRLEQKKEIVSQAPPSSPPPGRRKSEVVL
ncbi:MAG: hypothetical protein OSJ58_04170 [Dysosmobacter sp.]|uniref:DUF6674 family protein n=1 Tax=uncultured Oscillibacter sp. TaxID=876091 RepID=UPI00261867FA|nr:DUF6674 family protein [uncultured Oscillibacter sp.]MCX4371011.1 hypothetical protein [Dysosmobacter sp.]